MFDECTETVSILYAIVFGAGDACIEIGTSSILMAFGAFMVLVVIAQFAARWIWKQITQPRQTVEADRFEPDMFEPSDTMPTSDTPYRDDPAYRDSAIRSSKR
ncbi:hypothetical protein BC777_1819 [Yoonia maricola]|uniref:Uncharacterized protein n=1 Tax=Yoonia maricola TaxID=420999 RepID=A0A2M8WPU0_9RHOB|nr:hypothetical protein [Yoonia maricola]PJI92952.1 hypothetical protein BC777_1819 [Yoonia maricola]